MKQSNLIYSFFWR